MLNEKIRVSHSGREVWAEYIRPLPREEYKRAGVIEHYISFHTNFSIVAIGDSLWIAKPSLGILTVYAPYHRMVFKGEIFTLSCAKTQKMNFVKVLEDFCIDSAMRDVPPKGDVLEYLTFNEKVEVFTPTHYHIIGTATGYSVAE